jgi:hypothetical protein
MLFPDDQRGQFYENPTGHNLNRSKDKDMSDLFGSDKKGQKYAEGQYSR